MGLLGPRRRRPGGRRARSRRGRRTDAGDRRRGARRRVQRHRQLRAVVRPPHAVPDPAGAGLRRGVPAPVGVLPDLQPRLRRSAGRGGRRGRLGAGPGLPPVPGARDAPRAAPRPAHRALLPHPVGARGLLPDAARRHPRGAAGRHARRRPGGVPDLAVGGGLHALRGRDRPRALPRDPALGRAAGGRAPGRRPAPPDPRGRARPRRGRRVPARALAPGGRRGTDGRAARGDRRGPQDRRTRRPHRAVQEHRARNAGVPAAPRRAPGVARAGRPRGVRLPLAAGPRGVPGLHGRGAARRRRDQLPVRDARLDPGGTARQGRLRALAGRVPAGRRRPRQPHQGRHEPRRQGGPGRLRRGLRAGALAGGRGVRGTGRGRDLREPVRRDRYRAGAARGPDHAAGRTRRTHQAAGRRGHRTPRPSGSWTSSRHWRPEHGPALPAGSRLRLRFSAPAWEVSAPPAFGERGSGGGAPRGGTGRGGGAKPACGPPARSGGERAGQPRWAASAASRRTTPAGPSTTRSARSASSPTSELPLHTRSPGTPSERSFSTAAKAGRSPRSSPA